MFENKANEMMEKAQFIMALGNIYSYLQDKMHWDCMEYHAPDEDHEEPWFTDFTEDYLTESVKHQRKAYKAVLESIEKLAKEAR